MTYPRDLLELVLLTRNTESWEWLWLTGFIKMMPPEEKVLGSVLPCGVPPVFPRQTVYHLGKIFFFICSHESCWAMPLPRHSLKLSCRDKGKCIKCTRTSLVANLGRDPCYTAVFLWAKKPSRMHAAEAGYSTVTSMQA